ncbi:dual specificity protein phosphatase family protein [Agrobacterium sp. fls2-241-TYG-188a]|uniref:dual specificity protein phosphatase family protein n=1 Tax=Agrobacterium sp. fls2-241-TYG-188a TaxID=3040275 RepID=UPI00254CFF05|nr:dual specificity protein phosphatase family protein [Agrobacterium sp. fls2-241-TYG-188a]
MNMRILLVRGFAIALALPAIFFTYFGLLLVSGNFHEVIPGQVYRSSQLSDSQLAQYVKANGIKTIINLRGENERSSWYRHETQTAEKLGVQHIDFGMSARKQLAMARMTQLAQIMRDAPKPILIHCKSGADRTGLASAIYVSRVAGLDEETAERQLSIRYGHLGIPYLSSAYAMDRSWEELEHVQTLTSMTDVPKDMI